jgi:hypothetical protein
MSLAALIAALFTSLAPAGGQSEGESNAQFEVIKDVHGDGPTSGFVVEWTCVDRNGDEVDSGTLTYDNIVDGHETQVVDVEPFVICSIEETNSNGADLVEYECEFFPGQTDDAAAEGVPGGCNDQQSATFSSDGDFGSFLVRNTFDPEVIPDDDEPDVTPDVVDATPAFTG